MNHYRTSLFAELKAVFAAKIVGRLIPMAPIAFCGLVLTATDLSTPKTTTILWMKLFVRGVRTSLEDAARIKARIRHH